MTWKTVPMALLAALLAAVILGLITGLFLLLTLIVPPCVVGAALAGPLRHSLSLHRPSQKDRR